MLLIMDTTLRDGEQTPGVNLGVAEKRQLARALRRMKVDIIEAGFAAASRGDFAAISAIAAEDWAKKGEVILCSLARCVAGDIQTAAEALKEAARPRIHLFIAASPLHMEHKLRMTPESVLARAAESVAMARGLCGDVQFSAEDATRAEPEFLFRLLEAVIKAGASTVNLPDTVGYATVREYGALMEAVRANVSGIDKVILSAHCHNDLGLGVANTLEAVRCGARQVEATLCGLGERAGNAALEEIVMGLAVRRDVYGIDCSVDTRQIFRATKLAETLTGVELSRSKAIVGENAFRHESGIHQHGVMAHRATYEVMDPAEVGVPRPGLVLGKLSGRHAFDERLRELGYAELAEGERTRAFERFKELCDRKGDVTDRDLEALLSAMPSATLREAPETFALEAYQIYAGNLMTPTATVKLTRNGVSVTEASVGDGPINAAYSAIERITGLSLSLESYVIRAVGGGADALGEVTVRVRGKVGGEGVGGVATGRGISTDILEASIRAYIDAANKLAE